jgi:5-methylcytosine-specific restriction enzyme A
MRARSTELWSKFAAKKSPQASAWSRGYDAEWRQLAEDHLRREPTCRLCAIEGVMRQAQCVDHIQSIRKAPARRLDDTNLQSLCYPCHRSKTNRHDGGFGNLKR